MKLLLDPEFWSAAVATLMLVLAIVQYVQSRKTRPKLEVEVPRRVVLSHKVGHSEVELMVRIRNRGGREIEVRNLVAKVSSGRKLDLELPAQSLFPSVHDQTPVIFVPFVVGAGEEWFHVVRFYCPLAREEQDNLNTLVHDLRKNIMLKRDAERRRRGDDDFAVEADPDLVGRVTSWFKNNFEWRTGEYKLEVCVETDQKQECAVDESKFVVFESDVSELRSYARNYRWGLGVCFPAPENRGIAIEYSPNNSIAR